MRLIYYILIVLNFSTSAVVNDKLSQAKELLASDTAASHKIVNTLLADESLDDFERSRALGIRGYIRQELNLQAGLWDYLEAVRFLDISNNTTNAADDSRSFLYNQIARIYYKYKNYVLAIDYYKKALEIAAEGTEKNILYNIGLAQSRKGLRSEAVKTLLKTLEYSQDDINQQAKVYTQLGIISADAKDFERAIEYQFKIINQAEKIKARYVAKAHHNLALTYTLRGDTLKAIEQLKNSIDLRKGKDQFVSLQDLSELYMNLGMSEQCLAVGQLAESIYPETSKLPHHYDIFRIIAEAHFAEGNVMKYRRYMNLYADASDNYNNLKRHATEKGERELIAYLANRHQESVEEANRRKNLTWIIPAAAILAIISIFGICRIYAFSRKKKRIEKAVNDLLKRHSQHL